MNTESNRPHYQAYTRKRPASLAPFRLPGYGYGQKQEQETPQRNAELFYLQKQIQTQTPMVIVLEGGDQVKAASSGTTETPSRSAAAIGPWFTSPPSNICTKWAIRGSDRVRV